MFRKFEQTVNSVRRVHTEINVLILCPCWITALQRHSRPDSICYDIWLSNYRRRRNRAARSGSAWDFEKVVLCKIYTAVREGEDDFASPQTSN